jgi:hypothetical protein
MDKTNCIAYKGAVFTIEWYFDERGKSQAYKYYSLLSDMQKRKLLLLFKRIGDFGQINDITKFRYEGNEIFAFKPKPDRFLSFFVKGNKIIVANGFQKKTQKLPHEEKERAIRSRNDYYKRIKEGKYYE